MSDVPAKPQSGPTRFWNFWLTLGVVLFFALQVYKHFLPQLRDAGVAVTSRGDALVYGPSAWLILPIALPVAFVLVPGICLIQTASRLKRIVGAVVLVAAAAMMVVIAPTMLSGGLVLGRDGFTFTHGFWWRPVSRTVRFDDLELIKVVHARNSDGSPDETLACDTRAGGTVTMPLGDVLRVALPEIRERAGRHGVDLIEIQRRGRPVPPGSRLFPTILFLAPTFVVVFLLYLFVLSPVRRHPTNRMSRRLQAGDFAGAIAIGESVPPERREFSTRCNLAIAYERAGRAADARATLADLEAEGWNPSMGPEEQHKLLLDHVRGIVAPESRPGPPDPAANPS